jgi:hypothetical protein
MFSSGVLPHRLQGPVYPCIDKRLYQATVDHEEIHELIFASTKIKAKIALAFTIYFSLYFPSISRSAEERRKERKRTAGEAKARKGLIIITQVTPINSNGS